MTPHALRSVASYHAGQALRLSEVADKSNPDGAADLRSKAVWHENTARELSEHADGLEAAGKLLTDITGNFP